MNALGRRAATIGKLAVAAVLFLAACGAFLGGCVFSAPRYRGPVTDHFDGKEFHSPWAKKMEVGFSEFVHWQRTRDPGAWHSHEGQPPGPPPPHRVGRGELRVTYVNHATVLVQMDGLNLLTDPIWSERASPVSFAGPRRHRPPGIRFEDLPPIDAVLLSHNHYDHLDLPTLKRLLKAFPHARFFGGLGIGLLLERSGIPSMDLDWWQESRLSEEVTLVSVPVQHFSSRGFGDRNATLWTGFAVHGPSGWVYFAGDTGYGPHFQMFRERFGPPRVALLPIGAYRPEWFMAPVHMSPAEAVRAAQDLGAKTSIPIHFGTFQMADDGEEQPVEDLRGALAKTPQPPEFWVLGFGEGRDVPPSGAADTASSPPP